MIFQLIEISWGGENSSWLKPMGGPFPKFINDGPRLDCYCIACLYLSKLKPLDEKQNDVTFKHALIKFCTARFICLRVYVKTLKGTWSPPLFPNLRNLANLTVFSGIRHVVPGHQWQEIPFYPFAFSNIVLSKDPLSVWKVFQNFARWLRLLVKINLCFVRISWYGPK